MAELIHAARLAPKIAAQLHAVWMAAYTQEAELLGASDFPPLRRSPQNLLEAEESAVLAYLDGELAGAVVVIVQGAPQAKICQITALVVAPQRQRQGVASALVNQVLKDYPDAACEVTTGVGNAPALALYHRLLFAETARFHVGPERLELVTLHRANRSIGAGPRAVTA